MDAIRLESGRVPHATLTPFRSAAHWQCSPQLAGAAKLCASDGTLSCSEGEALPRRRSTVRSPRGFQSEGKLTAIMTRHAILAASNHS